MKLRVASVGKDRSGLFQPLVQEYADRLRHYVKVELLELPASDKEQEAEVLLARRGAKESLWALDERGELLSSEELARALEKAQREAKDLLLIIGGDEGLSPKVREKADRVLSLSRMTFPHRLARLMLMEQLYRAFTILRGEPYHK